MFNQFSRAIFSRIMSGEFSSSTLETELASATSLGAFQEVMSSPSACSSIFSSQTAIDTIFGSELASIEVSRSETALNAIAESSFATFEMCKSSVILKEVFHPDYPYRLDHWMKSSVRKRYISDAVNHADTKLKREIYDNHSEAAFDTVGSALTDTLAIPAGAVRWSFLLMGGGAGAASS